MTSIRKSSIITMAIAFLMTMSVTSMAADKLVFMHWSYGEWWQETIDEFARIHDIEVEYVVETDYADKLLTMVAGGQAPDVFAIRFDLYPTMALKGQLLDISSRIENDPDLQQVMLPQDKPRSMVDGKWYGLGFKYTFPHVYYDREAFAQAGVADMPANGADSWSWDEFVQALRKLRRRAGDGSVERYGLSVPMTNWVRMGSLIHTFGVDFVNSNGVDISSPKAIEAMITLNNLFAQDLLAPHASVANSRRRLPSGQAAIIMDLDGAHNSLADGSHQGRDWYGLAGFPAGMGASVGRSYMFGENLSIHPQSSNPDLAFELLKFAILRSWNVDSDMPYIFQGRSGDELHSDERTLFNYALQYTTMVTPFVGQEVIRSQAMNAVRQVVEGREPPGFAEEVQRQINNVLEEIQADLLSGQ